MQPLASTAAAPRREIMVTAIYGGLGRPILICLSLLLALPSVATGSAQPVVQVAERERWHG